MNPVKRRIWEWARFELGLKKKYVRKVCRKTVIQNKRYAWRLFSAENDTIPIDEVVLDVDASEALRIDRDLGVEVTQICKSSAPIQITVLLADDHAVVRQGLCSLLQAETDLRVVGEAENGQQAVEMTKRLEPDVVVMDLAMPVLDGLDAIRQIHSLQLKSKVLILSCHGDDSHVQQTIDAGAIGYVV